MVMYMVACCRFIGGDLQSQQQGCRKDPLAFFPIRSSQGGSNTSNTSNNQDPAIEPSPPKVEALNDGGIEKTKDIKA